MTDTAASSPTRLSWKVVAAVDGSDGSRTALRWAASLARQIGAPLQVVQSWEYPASTGLPWGQTSHPAPAEVDRHVRQEVADLVAEEVPADVTSEVRVLRGPATTSLVGLADTAEGAPLMLVVGSRGRGGFPGLLLGSVSSQLLEHATCPVAVVPPAARAAADEVDLSTLVVGLDGSPAGHRALDYAVELSDRLGASLSAVHAFVPAFSEIPPEVVAELREDVTNELDEQCRAHLEGSGPLTESVMVDGDPRTVLLEAVAERRAGALVVAALGAGSVQKHLGPVAAHLASRATVPLVVVR